MAKRFQAGKTSFADKTAFVTGGASGIGKALGAELFKQGAHVVLADIDGEAAERAANQVSSEAGTGGSIVGAALDVRDRDAVRTLVEDVAARRGRIDLMFNNAGIAMGGETHDMVGAHWDRVIDINLNGVVNGVLAAYPLMVAQGHGHIVNTASTSGLMPTVFLVAYTATKHAVVGLSTTLRPEAAALGVRVSVLIPGAIDTPILDRPQPLDLPVRSSSTASMTGREYLTHLPLQPIPAEEFAPRALRGVARNKAIIIVPGNVKALWYLHRLSPGMTERVTRRLARRILADAQAKAALRNPTYGS